MSFEFIAGNAVKVGATSVSIFVTLVDTSGNVVTGEAFGDMTGSYIRQGGTRQAISVVTLGAVDADYSSGGFVEVDATNIQGGYRLDVPDDAWATGASWVTIALQSAATEPQQWTFAIVKAEAQVDVTHWIGTAAATPTVAGVPEVDVTYVTGIQLASAGTGGQKIGAA